MSAISLINSGVAWFVAAAVLAFLFSFQKALSGWIAGIGGAVGSLYTAAAGFTVLTGAVGVSGALSLVSYDVQISPLNAIWLITLGLCGLFVSLYNIDWHRHAQVKCNGLQINMLMAAAVCAVIASNLGMFVVMAEIMALCAVFLTSNSKEGKLWFALGRLGTLLLAIACWLLWQRYGTLDLRLLDMRMQQLPLGSDIWLLGVIGFGLLAGIIPLHGWVPQAHANASAPAAALFSTVVMKIGLLGILTLSLLGGNAPLWWGIALLVLGMITAFVGGLYALMEHNIQRLLAYHTLENIGIILLGMGALASLEHLSDPTVSFYTITNVGTSWLSREILFVGLFGAGLLLWLITLNAWARRLAAILGLAFVYVMSRVYTIPTVPFWNSLFTYWLFLATSLLLGSSLLLFMDALAARKDPEKKAALLLGWYPVFIVLAFILQMLVIPLQLLLAQSPFSTYLLAWHLTLLLFGAALGPLLLIRNGVNEMLPGACRTCPCPLWIRAGIILLLVVAGEVCGRALFYSGYTWFGM